MSFNLTILMPNGVFEAKIMRIKKDRVSFPKCDIEGNVLDQSEVIKTTPSLDRTTQQQQYCYRLVNNKPKAKLKRTKVIKNYKLVDIKESDSLIVEQYYIVDSFDLQTFLLEQKKAVKTIFTSGNGYKGYEAYIYPYKDYLIMKLGWGNIDLAIADTLKDKIPLHQQKQILDTEVERLDENDLFEAIEVESANVYEKGGKKDYLAEVEQADKVEVKVK